MGSRHAHRRILNLGLAGISMASASELNNICVYNHLLITYSQMASSNRSINRISNPLTLCGSLAS